MKKYVKIWLNELKTKEAIKRKIEEAEENKKEYIKLTKIYNWDKAIVKENIKNYNIFINELKKAM